MNFFAEIVGQTRAIELLCSAIKKERIAPAYLFAGSRGIGRSLTAKCFSEILLSANLPDIKIPLIKKKIRLGNHPDLLWVEPSYLDRGQIVSASVATANKLKRQAPPQVRIEQIRSITQFVSRPPLEAKRSVVVIEDAQLMTEAAANALLKTLEEPGKATIVLIAPSRSLLPTIISRTQQIPFYPLSRSDLSRVLKAQNRAEILNNSEIVAMANGSPGVAIASFARLEKISLELLERLKERPQSSLEALQLAKEIKEQLDFQDQLWLVDYLQYYYWNSYLEKNLIEQLEKTRQYLLAYVQPRLVWETTLLSFC